GTVSGADAVNTDDFVTLSQLNTAVSGAGTVTSVDVSGGSTGLSFSGGPVTSSGTITTAGNLGTANGGTGATSASGARTNLGATTVGANLFTLANPSAVSFIRINADNTVTARSAADFRTDIGAGTFTLPALSSGSVLFSNGTTIAQDNTNFFWNDTNNRLGIRTTSPNTSFHVSGTATFGDSFVPGANNDDNILNIIVGENAVGSSNGIAFYETVNGFGMKLGYDGVGSGPANALRFYN